MFLGKVFLAFRTKCLFKLFNNTAYVNQIPFCKLSASVSFFSSVFLLIVIYHSFMLSISKDPYSKTSVFSYLNSSSFWFWLHSFLCWKSKRWVDLQSHTTFIFLSLSSHFKMCNPLVEESVAVRIVGEVHPWWQQKKVRGGSTRTLPKKTISV